MASAKGSCVCGEYTFEYTGDSFDIVYCNCVPCRKYYNDRSANLIVEGNTFQQLSGTEVTASRKGDSGNDVINHCCNKCLNVIWTEAKAFGSKIVIKPGLFDDASVRSRLKPTAEIYCRNRPGQFAEVPDVPHIEGAPPS